MNSTSDAVIRGRVIQLMQRSPAFIEGAYQRYSADRESLEAEAQGVRSKIAELEAKMFLLRKDGQVPRPAAEATRDTGDQERIAQFKSDISDLYKEYGEASTDHQKQSLKAQIATLSRGLADFERQVYRARSNSPVSIMDVPSQRNADELAKLEGRVHKERGKLASVEKRLAFQLGGLGVCSERYEREHVTSPEEQYDAFAEQMVAATKNEAKLRDRLEILALDIDGAEGIRRIALPMLRNEYRQVKAKLRQMEIKVMTLKSLAKGKSIHTGIRSESFLTLFGRTVRVQQLDAMKIEGISVPE
ncbi:hypothetical protein K0U07_01855 [bacterium]|nr:hypothetical protein [bacterium]